jgi:hypothetical protein
MYRFNPKVTQFVAKHSFQLSENRQWLANYKNQREFLQLITQLFESQFDFRAVLSPYHFLSQTTSDCEEEQPLIEAKARFTIDLLRIGC